MSFEVDKTSRGNPCIIIKPYKYRKTRELANKEITWRCLGKTCSASARTNSAVTELVFHKDEHTGDHPVTMMTLMSSSPNNSKANLTAKRTSDTSFTSLPSSPLVSTQLLRPKMYDVECQTDDLVLESKDSLICRIQDLTQSENLLIDQIQQLHMQLEVEKQKRLNTVPDKSSIAVDTADMKIFSSLDVQTDVDSCPNCVSNIEHIKALTDTIHSLEINKNEGLRKVEDAMDLNSPKDELLGSSTKSVKLHMNSPHESSLSRDLDSPRDKLKACLTIDDCDEVDTELTNQAQGSSFPAETSTASQHRSHRSPPQTAKQRKPNESLEEFFNRNIEEYQRDFESNRDYPKKNRISNSVADSEGGSKVDLHTKQQLDQSNFLGHPEISKSRWKQAQVKRQFVNSTRKRLTALPYSIKT